MRRELLLGCGHRRTKDLSLENHADWENLVTLDHNAETGCDVVHDLENPYLPFEDNEFDEIHAYEVLEHTGAQGDFRFFFKQFEEYHRILKPNGIFFATVPKWDALWAWGDPSHTRVINEGTITFLNQKAYEECATTSRTDFRFCYKGDFETVGCYDLGGKLGFILKAIK